jgi:hypothetical protein
MKTLLVCLPQPKDVTAFYRATGPFGELLNRPDNNIQLNFAAEVFDSVVYLARATFLQRPYNDDQYQIAKMTKANRRPLWVDYDDDLLDIPNDNPVYEQYANPKIRKNIAEIVAMADIISVTTQALKDKLSLGPMKGKDIRVVPNALDYHRFNLTPKPKREPLIFWRGSTTHHKDVVSVAKQMVDNYREFPGFVWTFLGDTLWHVTDIMRGIDPKRCLTYKPIPTIEYMEKIVEMAPKVFMAPLQNHVFNRAKSNIAFLEAAYAGSLCIAPKFQEWDVPGCVTYQTPEEFGSLLSEILRGRHDDKAQVASNWVRENRSLSKVNELRIKIINDLIS